MHTPTACGSARGSTSAGRSAGTANDKPIERASTRSQPASGRGVVGALAASEAPPHAASARPNRGARRHSGTSMIDDQRYGGAGGRVKAFAAAAIARRSSVGKTCKGDPASQAEGTGEEDDAGRP